VTTKPDHRGERGVSRKTVVQGMPDRFGVPVVTMLVCFSFFAREAMGAACTRHSLRPLLERGTLVQDPDALASREDGRLAVQKPNRNALPSPSPGGGGSARKSEAKYVTGWGELIANASPHPAAHFTSRGGSEFAAPPYVDWLHPAEPKPTCTHAIFHRLPRRSQQARKLRKDRTRKRQRRTN
jgi:hypothetical protein